MELPAAASYPIYHTNGIEYFNHGEKLISCGPIISGLVLYGSNPEVLGSFTNSFITDIALIWDKMVSIFK